MNWFPISAKTNYSLLHALSKPTDLARRVVECGYKACAITDLGSVSGAIEFSNALKNACKNCGHVKNAHANAGKGKCMVRGANCEQYVSAKIKPILGADIKLTNNNRLYLLARNRKGWESLTQIISKCNSSNDESISLEELAGLAGDNLVIHCSGTDNIFGNIDGVRYAKSYEEAKSFLKPQNEVQKVLIEDMGKYKEIFKDKFFLSISLLDEQNSPIFGLLSKSLRWLSKKENIPIVANAESYYARNEDAVDHRAILAIGTKSTLENAKTSVDSSLFKFFNSNKYYLPSVEELEKIHTKEELENSSKILEMIEDFEITNLPMMPKFELPKGQTDDDYLKSLCEVGWAKKIINNEPEYSDRLKMELGVFKEAGLAPYFLVVQDYCKYAVKDGGMIGRARGSGGGCLASYLLGITDIDPVKYELLFERFYNSGRNSPGRVAMPDIDVDFPVAKRDDIISYVKNKYGDQNVGQIATFGRLMGAGTIKDVFRIRGRDFKEANKITEFIPDKDKISDELQETIELEGEASIIGWALENHSKELSNWVKVEEGGKLSGPYAKDFEQAIRLEGTKKSIGRHPSGIIISPRKISEFAPIAYVGGQPVVAFEMNSAEAVGLCKFDILGTSILDKLTHWENIVRTGKIK